MVQGLNINIYILTVVVLVETNNSGCLHFSMQKLKYHVLWTQPLGGVMSTPANKSLSFYRQLRDDIHVSPRRYVHEFSLPGCSNTSITNEIFHFIRITDGVWWKI